MTAGAPGIDPIAQRQLAAVVDRQHTRPTFRVTPKGPRPLSATETKELANKAFRRARWHRETFLDALDAISRAMRLLDDTTLAELIWRGQQTAGHDGYTSTPTGERVAGNGSDTKLTTVEAAAAARIEDPTYDPAGVAIRDMMAALWTCSNESAVIDRCAETLLHIHDTTTRAKADDKPICAGCNKEILKATRLHRIDGQPYHAEGSPNCYRAENWRRRGNGDNEQHDAHDGNDVLPSLISEPPCQ